MSQAKPLRPVPPFTLPLEGRILAHRRILIELIRDLPSDRRAQIMDWLDERAIYGDGQKDSGAVSEDAVEVELARADEFQVLRRLMRTRTD